VPAIVHAIIFHLYFQVLRYIIYTIIIVFTSVLRLTSRRCHDAPIDSGFNYSNSSCPRAIHMGASYKIASASLIMKRFGILAASLRRFPEFRAAGDTPARTWIPTGPTDRADCVAQCRVRIIAHPRLSQPLSPLCSLAPSSAFSAVESEFRSWAGTGASRCECR